MICVARRVTAVERTESFSTRHELSGEDPPPPQTSALRPRKVLDLVSVSHRR